ncbi:hypothetical protein JCM11251_003648 [Rhodosporidiobolus azoricus]
MATTAELPTTLPLNPHLTQPVLYCSGCTSSTSNEAIVNVLKDCLRCRLNIERDENNPEAPAHGKIEFESLYKAEVAYATCNNHRLSPTSTLTLSFSPLSSASADPAPSPSSVPRLIKQLPLTLTASTLFALCRPYGPIYSLTLLLAPPTSHAPSGSQPRFKGHALVHFYAEEDAQKMQEGMHFSKVGGQNIAVSLWDVKRAEKAQARGSLGGRSVSGSAYPSPGSSPRQGQDGFGASPSASPSVRTSRWATEQAAPSTPSKYTASLSAGAAGFTPPSSREMSRNASGASQWSVGSVSGGGEASPKTGGGAVEIGKNGEIDPCNLFIKSLPAALLSPHLHALFSPYGQIVSARVMTDPTTSRSKEFGFVSFTTPSAAEEARKGVDGSWVAVGEEGNLLKGEECRGVKGAKRVTVRVHEKKEVRQARASAGGLEESFAGLSTSSTPDRLPSGAVAPSTPSPSQPSASRWASPSPSPAASPALPKVHSDVTEDVPAAPLSERQRLVEAVKGVKAMDGKGEKVKDVVALLESLPKKERALCLFNPSVLAQKVQDALTILDDDDEEGGVQPTSGSSTSETAFATPAAPPPATASPPPQSLADLASLPFSTLLPLLRTSPPPLGLSAPEEEKVEETDAFMDGLEGKPVSEVKQKLGERVFKAIKAEGVKGAPRITIELLDSEPDLRALAHVAAEWREVLKVKAEKVAEELKAKK